MASVAEHYEKHLAPIYLWMAGGLDHALSQGTADVAEFVGSRRYAADLPATDAMQQLFRNVAATVTAAGMSGRWTAGPRGLLMFRATLG